MSVAEIISAKQSVSIILSGLFLVYFCKSILRAAQDVLHHRSHSDIPHSHPQSSFPWPHYLTPSRPTGPTLNSLCGPAITRTINNDNTSHVEGLPELLAAPYSASTCNLWLCKGLQFSDNPANNTQVWSAGQVVPLKVWIRIPHEGSANVSIVDTKRNEIVGDMLKVWEEGYAPGKSESDVPIGQREFSVTIPEGLEEKCAVAGDCVLQWWWYGNAAKQTYESCVDFKIAKMGAKRDAFGRAFKG